MAVNSIVLRGRLGKAPETRFTPNGVQVTNFTMAVDRGWGDRKRTMWIKVQLWRKQAENAMEWLNKGDDVIVRGELDVSEWTDEKGIKHSMNYVVADFFERCGGKKNDGSREPNGGFPEGSTSEPPQEDEGDPSFTDADEIPF